MPPIIVITAMAEVCPKSSQPNVRAKCLKVRVWLCVVYPSLRCEGNGEISVLSPGMPSSGGHTVSVVAACG